MALMGGNGCHREDDGYGGFCGEPEKDYVWNIEEDHTWNFKEEVRQQPVNQTSCYIFEVDEDKAEEVIKQVENVPGVKEVRYFDGYEYGT